MDQKKDRQKVPVAIGSGMGIRRPRRHHHAMVVGEKVGKNNANCKDCKSKWSDGGTLPHGSAPVGSFAANPFGILDTAGNVFEWVEDCWNESYAGAPSDTDVWKTGDCRRRVLRGGSWDNLPGVVRSASRIRFVTEIRYSYFGFRIARTLP